MNIIQVTPNYLPSLGGVQIVVKELCSGLAKRGNRVEVFTSDLGCGTGKLKSTKTLKINYLRSWQLAHTPIIPSLISRLMKISKNSIIHIHASRALVPEITILACKLKNLPFVVHMHGNLIASGKAGVLLPLYKRFFLKRVLNNADRIVVLNHDYQKFIEKTYAIDKKKIVIIPNATKFKIIKTPKTGLHKPVRLLYVGRFTIEKNIPAIVKSLNLLKSKNLELYLVGDGEDKENLKNLIDKEKLQDHVKFTGTLKGKKLYKQYLDSDILILPSKIESFGIVLLEAMATATPIIASNIPGIRTIIKNGYNGLLVKPNPKNIAKAVERLIKGAKLRQKLAENGLREVKKYSWDKIVEQTEQVYREVIKEHKNENK